MQGTDVLFPMKAGMWMANNFHCACHGGFLMGEIISVWLPVGILKSEHLNVDVKTTEETYFKKKKEKKKKFLASLKLQSI